MGSPNVLNATCWRWLTFSFNSRYGSRDVLFLIGGNDVTNHLLHINAFDAMLDTSPEAMLQG